VRTIAIARIPALFDDWGWISSSAEELERRCRRWLGQIVGKKLIVLEFGAAAGVPAVRRECERRGGLLIRVNPRDTAAPLGSIILPMGALQAMQPVDRMIQDLGGNQP
jgi:hypothetical protein